jgi:Mg-chelatase subunit ChlD
MQTQEGFVMPSHADVLRKACIDNNLVEDADLVLDVYLVCQSSGQTQFTPDEKLMGEIERTDPAFWTHRMDINNRRVYLENLSQMHYMQALVKLNDPLKAVLTFIDHVVKAREAYVKSLSKRKEITDAAGTFAGYANADYLALLRQKFDGKVSLPDLDQHLTFYQDVCEEDGLSAFMASSCGLGTAYDARLDPGQALAQGVVQLGTTLPESFHILYKTFTHLTDLMGIGKTKTVNTPDETEKKRRDQMESFDQVSTVNASDMASDQFETNLAEKKLEVTHNSKEESGRCHVFVLLDVSSSMESCDLGGRVCRAFAANILTLSLLQFAMDGQWTVHVVPFAGTVSRRVQSATDKASAIAAMKWLGKQTYSGSSTDIEAAVLYAYKALGEDENYRKCDIVLITDGCSPITDRIVKEKPDRTKLRTLVVSREIPYGDEARNLAKASDHFVKVDWDNNNNHLCVGDALNDIKDKSSNDDLEDKVTAKLQSAVDAYEAAQNADTDDDEDE